MRSAVSTVLGVNFHDYVQGVAREKFPGVDTSDARIGSRIGTTGPTVGSWKHGEPNIRFVIAFAEAYGVSLTDALCKAYDLKPEQLGAPVSMDPNTLSNDQLIEELRRRLDRGKDDRSRKMVRDQQAVKRQRQSRDQSRNVSRNLRDS